MPRLAALFLVALVAPSLVAQTLTGRVSGSDDLPLSGATVVLLDVLSQAQRAGAATNAEGRYRLTAPVPGTYTAVFSFVGRAPLRQRVTLSAGETVSLDATLPVLALHADEVVVAAGRAAVGIAPITATNVTARDLERMPDVKDLPVLLASKPSVTYYSENGNGIGYTYLRMRGFDERRIAVSINGIPQNDPEDLSVYWINFFDLQGAVTDIQIQRGAGAALYGSSAVAGALNIVTDPYTPDAYASVEGGYGAYGTSRMTAEASTGLVGGNWSAFGRISRLRSDGYRDWSWAEFTRFFAGVTRYGERSRLTIQAYGGPQRDALAYYGIRKADNESDSLRTANPLASTRDSEWMNQPHFELLHEYRIDPEWTLNQTAYVIRASGHFDGDASWRSAEYLRLPQDFAGLTPAQRQRPLYEVLSDPTVLFRSHVNHWHVGYLPRATFERGSSRLTLGGEARINRAQHWGRVEEAAMLPPQVIGPEHDARVYEYHVDKTVVAGYASLLTRPLPALAVQADLQLSRQEYRFHGHRFFGTYFRTPFVFVNPRVGATLFPEQPLRFYASIAYGHREPRRKDLFDASEAADGAEPQFRRNADGTIDFDAPLVRPERGLSIETGATFERERVRLNVTGYLLSLTDEIVRSGGLDRYGVPRTGNADRTRHLGLEVDGIARLLPGLDLEGNVSVSRDRFVRFTEYKKVQGNVAGLDRSGNRIAGFPDRTANLALRYERAGWGARVEAHHVGRIQVDNSASDATEYVVDPQTLVNAGVSYGLRVPRGHVRLSLDVNNVLDQRVLLYGTGPDAFFPAATRHLFVGLRYTVR